MSTPPPSEAAYWESGEIETAGCCPACAEPASAESRYRDLRDDLEDVPGAWAMHLCDRCGSLFLAERPVVARIGKAYRSYYTHASGQTAHVSDNGDSLLWKLANGYLNARFGSRRAPALAAGEWLTPLLLPIRQQLDCFYRHLPRTPGRLLDVGCGNGVFLLRALEAGWQVMGLEPDPLACEAARSAGLAVQMGTLDSFRSHERFDYVTASHVIEHVHDPRAFVGAISGALRAGGRVWIATPNAGSLGRRWYGASWRGLEPPRHITVFSASALHDLLDRTGFENIRFHRRGRGARYILKTSHEVDRKKGSRKPALPAWWVDLGASCVPVASEELIVSATWPGA